jgi:hypothetical protein
MPGQNPSYQTGPLVYEALSAVKGGQVVEFKSGATTNPGKVGMQPAAANSAVVLGVAFKDAVPVSAQDGYANGTTGYANYPVTDISVPDELSSVYNDAWIKVTYAAAATYRQPLKAAANGQVTPGTPGTDPIIGWCAAPGGVAANGVGLARILV